MHVGTPDAGGDAHYLLCGGWAIAGISAPGALRRRGSVNRQANIKALEKKQTTQSVTTQV
jgi:hypothetical protein